MEQLGTKMDKKIKQNSVGESLSEVPDCNSNTSPWPKKKPRANQGLLRSFGVPKGIRTPVTDVKGRCPWPLDDGDEF